MERVNFEASKILICSFNLDIFIEMILLFLILYFFSGGCSLGSTTAREKCRDWQGRIS